MGVLFLLVLLLASSCHSARAATHVRITAFEQAFNQTWSHPAHDGQSVLNLIRALKPTVLNRFVTGLPSASATVPNGSAPIPFTDYLTLAMAAGGPGCTIAPKVHLNDIWPDAYRMAAAAALRNLSVHPQLTRLDLDCYFSNGTNADHKETLEAFLAMGWEKLGFNFVGGDRKCFGLIEYGEAAIQPGSWSVSLPGLDDMRKDGVTELLAHIDYPNAIAEFGKLSGDRQAAILTDISASQKVHNFSFIWPIIYSGYDATTVTLSDGKTTVFDVIVKLIEGAQPSS